MSAPAPPEDDGAIRRLFAHVEPPAPDAAFVRRLRDMLVCSCPAVRPEAI